MTVRLLLADDDSGFRETVRHLVVQCREAVVVGEAADGEEALELATVLRPDVVLLDLEMPGIDGYAACRLIKQRGLAGAVVVLSIHATPEDVRAAAAAGADRFVAKGADLGVLLDAILQPRQRKEKPWLPQ
jgi:DNA-binding NarL/FixJ family response regulator